MIVSVISQLDSTLGKKKPKTQLFRYTFNITLHCIIANKEDCPSWAISGTEFGDSLLPHVIKNVTHHNLENKRRLMIELINVFLLLVFIINIIIGRNYAFPIGEKQITIKDSNSHWHLPYKVMIAAIQNLGCYLRYIKPMGDHRSQGNTP